MLQPLLGDVAKQIYLADLQWATIGNGWMWANAEIEEEHRDDPILRVEVKAKQTKIDLIGLKTLDYDLKQNYSSVDELPNWVQEKLALLMLMSTKPPTQDVKGVGRRISESIFWVYPPEEMLR